MSDFLDRDHTGLPPPRSTHVERDAVCRSRHYLAPAAIFVGTLVVIVLAIVSALTLLAATPTGFAFPTTLVVIGALAAGGLAIRTRMALNRHALAEVPRSPEARRTGSSPTSTRWPTRRPPCWRQTV